MEEEEQLPEEKIFVTKAPNGSQYISMTDGMREIYEEEQNSVDIAEENKWRKEQFSLDD